MFEVQEILKDRYQLQKQVRATATEYQTWLALDKISQRQVTLKLLAFSRQLHTEELKLFDREGKILQSLNHPRIPKYWDCFDIDKYAGGGVPWFALVRDYIPGYSLQKLIDEGRSFSEKQLRSIASQVLEILIYLHQLDPPVMHRDIKPSNLILGEDGQIYVVDFGALQTHAAAKGITFTLVGSEGYTPLEQFSGQAVPASDLYALGATLIHLLTGISPVNLPQTESGFQLSDLSTETSSFFVRWLEKIANLDVEKRFRSAKEASLALNSEANVSTASAANKDKSKVNKIRLIQSQNKLTIDIPHSYIIDWRDRCFYGSLLMLKILFFKQFFIWENTVNHSWWIVFVLLILGIYMLFVIFEKTKVDLTEDSLGVEKILFSLKYGKKEFKLSKILKLKIESYREGLYVFSKTYKKICLQTKNGPYNIAKISKENNSDRLTEKMNQWLKSRGRSQIKI